MNTKLLLFIISIAALSSCTTLYKSGQTPDDVYFSPVRHGGYSEKNQSDQVYNNQQYDTYGQQRVIRMGINDSRWRYLDYDYSYNPYISDYSYSPYSYGFNYGYYYNPYYWPYPVYNNVFITPSNPKNTTPRMTNLSGYNHSNGFITNSGHGSGMAPVRPYNNTNNGSAFGNAIRQVLSPSNSNNSNSNSNNNTRSYTPSNSGSSSSGSRSSSGGGGSVSRPPR